MVKLLDKIMPGTTMAQLIELGQGFLVNGQYYDKNTMSPIPFKTISSESTYHKPYTRQSIITRYIGSTYSNQPYQNFNDMTDTLIIDSNDPNTSYKMVRSQDMQPNDYSSSVTARFERIIKCTVIGNDVQLKENYCYTQIAGEAQGATDTYLGQDEYFLYFASSGNRGTTSYSSSSFIYRINKETLGFGLLYNRANISYSGTFSKIFETPQFIYFFRFGTYYAMSYVEKLDKSTGSVTSVATLNSNQPVLNTMNYAKGHVRDGEKYVTYFFDFKNTTPTDPDNCVIRMVTVNPSAPTLSEEVSYKNAVIDWGTSGITKINPLSYGNTIVQNNRTYDAQIITIEGIKYLNIAVYYRNSDTLSTKYQGLYTFKIEPDFSLKFIKFINFSSSDTRGIMYSKDKKMIVAGTENTIVFLNFNVVSGSYEKTDEIPLTNKGMGLDSNDNLWVTDLSNNLHFFTPDIPTFVGVEFENKTLKYEGTDLDSNIIVDASNYNGARVEITLDLSLKGPVVFKDNSSKTITVTTGKTDKIKIPIKIKGSGSVSVYPKLVL